MKRLFTLFCAAGLLLSLAACGRQAEEPASTLKPHVFSEETETMIDLLTEGQEAFYFYDYDVDESILSCRTAFWVYEDGAMSGSAADLNEQEIVPGQEICLYVRLRAPEGADSLPISTESFRSYPCSAGYAVTVTFYDTPLSESE